jgi:hypothetical protein
LIIENGLESLSDEELMEAARERGFVESETLLSQESSSQIEKKRTRISFLKNWISLSTRLTTPHSLLVFYAIVDAQTKVQSLPEVLK